MNDLVFKSEKGNSVTTSYLVAEKFEKRHADVLRSIDNLECSDNFRQRNFAFVENQQVGAIKTRNCIMTKDGFSFLVMGFTGARAAQFKEDFIEAFNKMDQTLKSQLPQSFAEALQLAANQAREIEDQQKQLALQAPKVLFADAVTASSNSVLIAELSRILKQNGLNIGQNRLFERLRQEGYLLSKGEYYNLPSQTAMDLKIFEIKETPIVTKNGSQIKRTVMVTAKGLDYFVKKYVVNG